MHLFCINAIVHCHERDGVFHNYNVVVTAGLSQLVLTFPRNQLVIKITGQSGQFLVFLAILPRITLLQ